MSSFGAFGNATLPIRIGRYTLIKRLAVGGMAELFLAIQKSSFGFEKLVVIKCILPEIAEKPELVEMLLHEARTVAALSHPNIVQIFDVGEAQGRHFIAMEHAHGEDLRAIVRQMRAHGQKAFPLEAAIAIVSAAALGLAHAHEQHDLSGRPLGVVHRDVSPQNIVVTYNGEVKLVDFGIVQSTRFDETKSLGQLKGKIPYMSPEQARGEKTDARSDVFSLGIVLFELTTGKRLFKAPSEYEALKLICDHDYPLPRDIRPDYPASLERIVMRALAKDRAQRYATARELGQDLDAFSRTHNLVSNTTLREFMQHLFADKLAAERRAIAEGKALADLVEAREEGELEFTIEKKPLSLTPFALSIPPEGMPFGLGGQARRPRKLRTKRLAAWAGLGVMGAVVGVGTAHLAGNVTNPSAAAAPLQAVLGVTAPAVARADTPLVAAGMVEVVVKPEIAKAKVELDGVEQEGLLFAVPIGDEHTVAVSAPGFISQITNVRSVFHDTKQVPFELEKKREAPAAAPTASGTSPANAANAANTGAAEAPAVPAATGTLNVGLSSGWCNVAVDGAAKGQTPLAGVELGVGHHRVTCTMEDGKSLTAQVVVAKDTTTRYKFKAD